MVARNRVVGAVAGAISALIGSAVLVIISQGDIAPFGAILAGATPVVGALMGAWLAPRVDRSRRYPQLRLVLGMAIISIVVGAYGLATILGILDTGDVLEGIAVGAIYGTIAVIGLGWWMVLVSGVCALVWQWLMRFVTRRLAEHSLHAQRSTATQ